MKMIKLAKVFRQFQSGKNTVQALKNINLEISEGEFLAIVGPSGSGKSTLLNLIGGLDKPTEGEIFFNREKISSYSDVKLSHYRNQTVGFVFQEFNLQTYLNTLQNILLPTHFKMGRSTECIKLAQKLLQEVELTKKSHEKISDLSGGQKQRVAIARALINNPKIILADEPTGNLDLETGARIIKLLKKLHQEHKTTLIIATHDEKIAQAADRKIKIIDGQIK